MHIVFVNTLYPPHGAAGAETTLRLLAASMKEAGHACDVVTLTPDRQPKTGEVDGIPVHYLPLANVYWPHGPRGGPALRTVFQGVESWNPVMLRRLRRVLARLRPDVVNFHNLQGFTSSAWSAAHGLGIPAVQTLHDYYTACPRSAMWRPGRGNCETLCGECRVFGATRRRLSRLPEAVTCVSHRVFDRLTRAGAFPEAASGKQIVRIIRGNNASDELPPAEPPAQGGAGPGRGGEGVLRLGFIGRLDPSKGVERLLEAVAQQPEGRVTLSIAGSGPEDYVASLRARASASVSFLGHVRPGTFFPEVDLLVIPSIWEDPFPRVFHEALAYGVPSLVGPKGGISEVIRDGENGFLFGPLDDGGPGPIAARLADLITNGWDRASVFHTCREDSVNYAPSHIGRQYESVFRAVATNSAVAGAGEAWRLRSPP